MGSGRFDKSAYVSYARAATTDTLGNAIPLNQVFTQRTIHKNLDPRGVIVRESCDSDDNPISRPIIIALDVTGSMGHIAHSMVKEQLGRLMGNILDEGVIANPHLMFMAVGDAACDSSPLQVSQFEADIRIAQQLVDIHVEGGGGGNDTESYDLPWYFAGNHTRIDSFKKRGVKGYLFTIGDEMPPNGLSSEQILRIFGSSTQLNYTAQELLDLAKERYEVFHLIIEEGSYAKRALGKVTGAWRELMGNRAVPLSDHNKLPEVISAIIRINEGADVQEVIDSYQDQATKRVIAHAFE